MKVFTDSTDIGSTGTIFKFKDFKGNEYIYDSNSNFIFNYSDLFEDILSNIENYDQENARSFLRQKYPDYDIDDLIAKTKSYRIVEKDIHDPSIQNEEFNSLWLNISHICNLRCVYCYGIDGTYGTQKTLMKIEDAKNIIDFWYKRLETRSKAVKVTFFGGEPTINKEVIKYSVNYLNTLLGDKYLIKYRITTNGTIMDQELLNLFKKNNFSVTVSIDGDEKTHNRNRPFADGNGSFHNAINTILSLQNVGIVNVAVRMTIVHDNVLNLEDNIQKLWDLGVKNVAINMVSSLEKQFQITCEDIAYLKEQVHNLAIKMMKSRKNNIYNFLLYGYLLHNRYTNNCEFFSDKNLLVETNGNVYPCHRLVGNDKFYMGNIFSGTYSDEKNRVHRDRSERCKNCWANKLCTSCPQINHLFNSQTDNPYNIYCDFNKILIEEGLKLYTTIQHNKNEKGQIHD